MGHDSKWGAGSVVVVGAGQEAASLSKTHVAQSVGLQHVAAATRLNCHTLCTL